MILPQPDSPATSRPNPAPLPLLLWFGLLGWMVIAPIGIGIFTMAAPAGGPPVVMRLLLSAVMAVLLLGPALTLLGLAGWRQWRGLMPFALALAAAALYASMAALVRAIVEPDSSTTILLHLTAVTLAGLLIGGGSLRLAGLSGRAMVRAFGLTRPRAAGLLLALGLVAIVTVGWPLTAALGDGWEAQLLLLQVLALNLPEAIFFWGAVLGLTLFSSRQHRPLAIALTLCLYLAYTPSLIVPHGDWGQLALLVTGIPFALLMIELRILTGSIWPGLLFALFYRAAPILFVDPRDELPLITQPWQTAAHLWMLTTTAGLVLLLWLGWQFLRPRWRLSRWSTVGVGAGSVLLLWAGWLGLWTGVGHFGFHDDGFLIIMEEQADLSGAETIANGADRRQFVRDRLIAVAEESQPPVRQALDDGGLTYRSFYLINMIRVEGNHARMDSFAGLPGVAQVLRNPNVRPYPFDFDLPYGGAFDNEPGVEWNIEQVQADEVWDLGVTGQGIVVAGQDTGYDWTHPALRQAYRGSRVDGPAEHTYNWHDAWSDATVPFDDDQHGTHTMGTVLGDDGNGNQIGMAPGARWIGCRNMQRGLGNPASYTDCMEFFLAPYPPGGNPFTDGDVTMAPHVINNSWGCPDMEGCDDDVLAPAVEALRAAGIMMVVSAGNSGPSCETVSEPPARYGDVFSVGATDSGGNITGFSSRGPVPDDGVSSLLKPDIAAPGENVRSSVPGGGYGTAGGTSMAGPHVAGLVALIWSANPNLIGQITVTEEIIRQSARPVQVSTNCPVDLDFAGEPAIVSELEALGNPQVCACGQTTGTPNNVYGWGEIDALAAVRLAMEY